MGRTVSSGATRRLLRNGDGRPSDIELFFDLVYVFAVTQLSSVLLHHGHASVEAAVHTTILLSMVWQIWVYTTWSFSFLDPDCASARAMLLVTMACSLVLSRALPGASSDTRWTFAITFVAIRIGRSVFATWLVRGHAVHRTFERIVPWSVASGVIVLGGAAWGGYWCDVLWAISIAVDLGAAAIGFWVPGLGPVHTREWAIGGGRFAERCQAFVLIALGESIVVVGAKLDLTEPTARNTLAVLFAFGGAVALWWVYFDRTARDSAERIANSDDPGALARSAFQWIHPLIIGGIIVIAAGDQLVLDAPANRGRATAWLVLGGTALFLAAHALFVAALWRRASWLQLGGAIVALGLVACGGHVPAGMLGLFALVIPAVIAALDRTARFGAQPTRPAV